MGEGGGGWRKINLCKMSLKKYLSIVVNATA